MNAVAQVEPDSPAPPRGALAPITPADLVRLAIERGADMNQIERFLDLQKRCEDDAARRAYVHAMAAFKTEPLAIVKSKAVGYKTKEGDFVGYKHAELSDITDVALPAMAKHGLSHKWDIRQESGTIYVDCIVTHELGHSEKVTMFASPDNSGKKNAIQQIASTVTYLQRYTMLAALGLSTKGIDDDGASSEGEPVPMTEDHQATVTALAQECSKTMLGAVLKSYKVNSLADIPDTEYENIVQRLNISRAEAQQRKAA
jgi:hypothetical protein